MPHRRLVAASALAAVALAATTSLGIGRGAPVAPAGAHPAAVRLVPQAIAVDLGAFGTPPTTAQCRARSAGETACYQPAQLQANYDLEALYQRGDDGAGETIVIVDAFGSPSIAHDLATFDAAFSLPAPPSFRILTPRGKIPPYRSGAKDRAGWAAETSLDVEWAHAIAPGASILLVETPTDEVEGTTGFPDIVAAENYVLDHHLGQVISQSFAATEETFRNSSQLKALRSAYLAAQRDHVTVLGGSGDLGATDYEYNVVDIYPYRVTSWPASDPLVTAVGGTKLDLSDSGTALAPPSAWNDTYLGDPKVPVPRATGGGRSIFFGRPSYQAKVAAVTGKHRGVPDVSMSAACSGLVDVYDSANGTSGAWQPMCGTSEATPLFAGIVAIADQVAGHALGLLNPALYELAASKAPGIVPVLSGDNTVSFYQGSKTVTVKGFSAGSSYNLATGVGTIDAASFVPELVAVARTAG